MRKINYILIGLFLMMAWSFEGHAQTKDTVVEEEPIFEIVEVMPEFPGGDAARQKFLRDNIVYPKAALEEAIEGTVVMSIIVEPDGSITNIEVARSRHKLLDEEALRVTKLMPNWKPATQRGKPVRARFRFTISFTLK